MARPNAMRTIEGESNLAERIQQEREERKWSYETLAKKMTDAGCSINGSALYKIEKGTPRRRITVDELVVLARIFDTTVEDLLTPMEILRRARAKEIVREIEEGTEELGLAVSKMVSAYADYLELAIRDNELREYVHNQSFRSTTAKEQADAIQLFDVEVDGRVVQVDQTVLREGVLQLFLAITEQASLITDAVYPEIARSRKEKK